MTDNIDEVLQERGKRYGEFADHARITYELKWVVHEEVVRRSKAGRQPLTPDQREALDMIFHKIRRILNGDPNYADSWIDIAGYAKLVADRLEKPRTADAPVDRVRGPIPSTRNGSSTDAARSR